MGRLKTLKEREALRIAKKAKEWGEAEVAKAIAGRGQGTEDGKLLEERAKSRHSFRTKKMGGM